MLPVRIELTTSALPRMRSTTELRQHVGWTRAYGRSAKRLSTRLAATPGNYIDAAMADKNPGRDERLAAALRDNLKRRKAQARDQSGAQADSSQGRSSPDS